MRCHQCGNDDSNENQKFCGNCGVPLNLSQFISARVETELAQRTRERDLIERETAIRIFEKVFGWLRILGAACALVAIPAIFFVGYKYTDLNTTISAAKQSVSQVATNERKDIEAASKAAQQSVAQISSRTAHEGQAVVEAAAGAKRQIADQTRQAQVDVAALRGQLQDAARLQPEMISIREELTKQQKVLSSSGDFVRSVFSSHRMDYFQGGGADSSRYKVLPRKSGVGATVYLLLSKPPIRQTLQLQYHIFAQPGNSYLNIHNLVIFSWGDPAGSLDQHELSASYFPDDSDTEIINTLSEADGRIYADGQPLFRFGEADPGFTGNKWIKVSNK